MTIYVDKYPEWLGVPNKWTGGGHLFGSDINELHTFAANLGLKRAWYQNRKGLGAGPPHYDLTKSKRILAIKNGAIHLESGIIPDDVVRVD